MRTFAGLVLALLTAFAGCVLAIFIGDYLTKLAHVPEMEGQRRMTVIFLCVPLGLLSGLVLGLIGSVVVRRQGAAGFLIALGWSLSIVCGIGGLLGGVPYLLSDKPPKINGKRLELQFEIRAPAALKIPEQPDGYSVRVNLYTDNRQGRFAFIDWKGITKNAEHVTIPGMCFSSRTVRADLFSRRPAMNQLPRRSVNLKRCRLRLVNRRIGPIGCSRRNAPT